MTAAKSSSQSAEETWVVADGKSASIATLSSASGGKTREAATNSSAVSYAGLFRYATAFDRMAMAIGLFFAICAGSANPFMTVVFGNMVNSFSKPQPSQNTSDAEYQLLVAQFQSDLMSQVSTNCLILIYVACVTFVATYVYMAVFVATGDKITHRIRQNYLRSVLRQNIAWHDEEGAGQVSTRISSDMLLIQDGISEKLPICVGYVSSFTVAFGIAFYRNWRLTFALISAIPLIAGFGAASNIFSTRFQKQMLNLYSQAGGIAEESFTAIRTVTAFNAQEKMSLLYASHLSGARNAGIKKSMIQGVGIGVMFGVVNLLYSLAFYYGGELLNYGLADAGEVVNVFFAVLIGAFSLSHAAPELQAFVLATSAGAKIFATIDRIPLIDSLESKGGKKLPEETVQGHIEFKNVKFAYPSRTDVQVLQGFSLDVKPGTSVALVGASGSGKSTIIQLLERFYDAVSGEILFDGVDIKDLNLTWLRQHIGYVSQEPTLFEGSVAENVLLGLTGSKNEALSDEDKAVLVQAACMKANAHDFIVQLPQGYDTQVGQRGLLLSGGQKQRIAIARAIVKDPKVLLLDEATSALDTTSERIVQAALDNASQGRTTITIAHRLSTIKNSSCIIVMSKGDVIETGTHEELTAIKNGHYAKLVEAQQLIQNEEAKSKVGKSDCGNLRSQSTVDFAFGSNITESGDEEKAMKTSTMSTLDIIKRIFKLNKPELFYICVGFFSAACAGMIMPTLAIVFSQVVGCFSEHEPKRTSDIHFWSVMFLVLAGVAAVSNFFQNVMFGVSSEFLTERVRKFLFSTVLRQNIAYFDAEGNSTGALTSNLAIDAQKVQGVSGVTFGTMMQMFFTLAGGAVVSFCFGWKLTLVALTLIPILVISSAFRITVLQYFHRKAEKAYAESAQVACENVAAIRTVQSLTNEKRVLAHYIKLLEQPVKDAQKSALMNTILYALAQSASFFGNAMVFYYGGHLVAYEDYTVTDFFVVFLGCVFGSMSAGRIFSFAPDITNAKNAAVKILAIFDRKPNIDSDSSFGESINSSNLEGLVEFRNVSFFYDSRRNVQVLKSLNLTVKPGQFVALVGPSGCGKSTTIGLIERFYDPVDGGIHLDGRDIRSFNLSQYRDVIGLVSQEPNLFGMTIEENIALGCRARPSDEQIISAAKAANIHDFIMSLPDGYKTYIGGKGSQLSGGQKQRIAIARALVRNPKILLLDEATSALDAESEKVVQEALDMASKGRTTIAIAHRLSSIQNADIIYFLKDGVVAESGTHQELYDQRGLYHELVIQQNLETS